MNTKRKVKIQELLKVNDSLKDQMANCKCKELARQLTVKSKEIQDLKSYSSHLDDNYKDSIDQVNTFKEMLIICQEELKRESQLIESQTTFQLDSSTENTNANDLDMFEPLTNKQVSPETMKSQSNNQQSQIHDQLQATDEAEDICPNEFQKRGDCTNPLYSKAHKH